MDKCYQLLLRAYAMLSQVSEDCDYDMFTYRPEVQVLLKEIPAYFENKGWKIGYSDFKGFGLCVGLPEAVWDEKDLARREILAPVPEGEF